jgi:hypothetical protein
VPRERDAHGRPRQTRPRDALGRPLPRDAHGVEPIPDEALPPDETIAEATRLLDAGRPFAAHEVFEARWKAAPEAERDLWQGLAQLCVGITHRLRGNAVGASRLIDRGTDRLESYRASGEPTYGVDIDAWVARAVATPSVR